MSILSTSGIVTRYVNYGENDRILTIFSPDRGRIDAKARGCRKPVSPLLPASQPFVYGEFELFCSKDKSTVNACQVKESFFPIREDYRRFGMGSCMLQLTQEAIQEGQPNEELFSLLYYSLTYLSYGETEPSDLLMTFLLRYLDVLGVRPSITSCAKCGRDLRHESVLFASPIAGGALCRDCAGNAAPVSKLSLEVMRRILLLPVKEICRVRLTEDMRRELYPLLTGLVGESLEYGPRSLKILQDATGLE